MAEKDSTSVRERQDPLRERYKAAPEEAAITDRARTTGGTNADPFHGFVLAGSEDFGVSWPFGIHRAVGGYHDAPNPGDVLCAALAACLDSTIRMIAERLDVTLKLLEVAVTADVDVRGTLLVDRTVPVGFQSMRCHVDVQVAEGTDPKRVQNLLDAAEHSCVVLQTLRSGVPVETHFSGVSAG
ncbi:MAG: OsmC family protein [Gemmatimonadota bacterium]|nr:OsmC family protein [Gemmatimonadota bacterium]